MHPTPNRIIAAGRFSSLGQIRAPPKVKIALLTTDGAGRTAVKADTESGKVTLHGKVESQAVKEKAESTARGVEGVTSVNNLIQVVPEARERVTKAMDKDVKETVHRAFSRSAPPRGKPFVAFNQPAAPRWCATWPHGSCLDYRRGAQRRTVAGRVAPVAVIHRPSSVSPAESPARKEMGD